MKMNSAVVCILLVQCIRETNFIIVSSTLLQKDRINMLREKIKEEIREKINSPTLLDPLELRDSPLEGLDYEQNERLPITPITDFDERKLSEKYKLRALQTTVKFDTTQDGVGNKGKGNRSFSQVSSKKNVHKKKIDSKNPLETFYRRIYDKEILSQHVEWVHCQDIITPFLTDAKLNISDPKRLNSKDRTVLRFISLLKVNTSTYSREDIYSILYQISNLNLRLFRWDVVSINILFNVIIKEKKHTLINLKNGLYDLFQNWRLDFSNTSSLLKQARIFRPPCVPISTNVGSTKLPKVTKYPKRLTISTPCEDDDYCNDH